MLVPGSKPKSREVRVGGFRSVRFEHGGDALVDERTAFAEVHVEGRAEKAEGHDFWPMTPVVVRDQHGEPMDERVAVIWIERPMLRPDAGRQAEAPPRMTGIVSHRALRHYLDVVDVHDVIPSSRPHAVAHEELP